MKIGGTSGITRGCLAALLALLATTASGATPPSIETFAAYSDFARLLFSRTATASPIPRAPTANGP